MRRRARLNRQLKAGALAFSLVASAVFSPAPMQAEPLEVNREGMIAMAAHALNTGEVEMAQTLVQAVLTANPEDLEALILQARIAEATENSVKARRFARYAWGKSRRDESADPRAAYAASMTMARAHAREGNYTLSQWWLRRAVEDAPDDVSRSEAVRHFQTVRRRNPWSGQLRFNIAPNSNINNGSANEEVMIFDLPFSVPLPAQMQALSGTEAAVGVTLRRALGETQKRKTEAYLQWDSRRFELSSEAKRKAPTAKAADYAMDTVTLGLDHRILGANQRLEYALGASVGHTQYGGKDYAWQYGVDLGVEYGLSPSERVSIGVGVDEIDLVQTSDARLYEARTRYQAMTGDGQLGLSLTFSQSQSPMSSFDYDQFRIGAQFTLNKPILGAEVSIGLDMRNRTYEVTPFGSNGREDSEIGASLGLVFKDFDYMGFAPAVTLSSSRTNSNIGIYDTKRNSATLGIVSSF